MSSRLLSYSEISTALTCQARHSFAYTGHLSQGQTLKRRAIAPMLSNGRAWGAAVAAWHAFSDDESLFGVYRPGMALLVAHEALRASYAEDILKQAELGVFVPAEEQLEREGFLGEILDHYTATTDQLNNLTRLEGELDQAIPSRGSMRSSSRYRFTGFLDGFSIDSNAHEWIVEFKLRGKLTAVKHIALGRQIRYYAWVRQRETGIPVVGAIMDERLAQAPKLPRLVQSKRKGKELTPSHAIDQVTTPEAYIALCKEFDVEPHPDTIAALGLRKWQQRVPIIFRPGELEEAGRELVSAAKLIRDLDSGELWPIRNAQAQLCNSCRFIEACANPDDRLYLDTIFTRTEPKRLRPPKLSVDSSSAPHSAPESSAEEGPRDTGDSGAESVFLQSAPSFADVRAGNHGSADSPFVLTFREMRKKALL